MSQLPMRGWQADVGLVKRLAASLVVGGLLLGSHPAQAWAAGPLFRDVTADVGLPLGETTSWGSAAADYDGDGRADLFLNNHTRLPALYRGGFAEASVGWPQPMDRHQCAWGEADGDGRPDLFCAQGLIGPDSPNELWLNGTDGFVEAAAAYGVDRPLSRARTSTWIDYDRDGDLDLFIGAYEQEGVGDVMLRNDRGAFVEVAVGVEAERNTNSATWADWNGDGWPDLLLHIAGSSSVAFANSSGSFVPVVLPAVGKRAWLSSAWGDYNGDGWPDLALIAPARLDILRNDRGTFKLTRTASLRQGVSAVWVDVNNDGRLDLYVVQRAPGWDPGPVGDAQDVLFQQRKGGAFDVVQLPETQGWTGSGDSAIALDHNQDGRMDLLVANGDRRWAGQTLLLENNFATLKAATLRLRGPSWNPLAFGVQITVKTSRFKYRRQLNDGVASHSQSDISLVHLGLRKRSAGRVTVRWPDGTVDCVRVTAGSTTELRIGSSPCP